MEMTIHWSPCNVQRVSALVDMGADSTLLYGNPDKFSGPTVTTEGYGGRIIHTRQVSIILGIRRLLPQTYQAYIYPTQEYILGIDVFLVLTINTTAGEFCLHIQVVKTIIQGCPHHAT